MQTVKSLKHVTIGVVSALISSIGLRTTRGKRKVSRTIQVTTALLAALAVAAPTRGHAQAYSIKDLGTLGGATSSAYNINASGQVVGQALNAAGELRPFLYSGGVMTDLGSLGGNRGYATGINDFGIVVGTSYTAAGHPHAFLWWGGVMFDMHRLLLGGDYSMMADINNANQMTGSSGIAGITNVRHAFVLTGTTVVDYGTLGGSTSDAFAINASGTICGGAYIGYDQFERACISLGTHLYDITNLGGSGGIAYDINDANTTVGTAQLASGQWVPFLWNYDIGLPSYGMISLGTLGGSEGRAYGINNYRQVLGTAQTTDGSWHAFLWSAANGMADLNTRLPLGSGWTLTEARALNDSGQIVGTGMHLRQQHAFLLTPERFKP